MSGDENNAAELVENSPLPFPYLHQAGLKLNVDEIRSTDSTSDCFEVSRIDEDVRLTNGIMRDIIKCLHPLGFSNERLFLFIKCVMPPSVETVLCQTNAKNFMTKIRVFNKNMKTAQKNKKTDVFLEELFVFGTDKPRQKETPRKRKLKQTVHSLTNAKRSLVEMNETMKHDMQDVVTEKLELQEELADLKVLDQSIFDEIESHKEDENRLLAEVAEKDNEINSLKHQLEELTNSKKNLQQKICGLKSGIKRKERSVLTSSSTSSTPDAMPSSSSKTVSTEISGIIHNDIVVATENLGHGMFRGARYFGTDSKFKRAWDGHIRTYAQFPDSINNPCVTKKELQKRVHFIEDIADNVSKGHSSELFTELVNLNKDVFTKIVQESDMPLVKLSAKDVVGVQSLLRLPTNKMRKLRICLNNLRMNILPSERKIRKEKTPVTSHMNKESIETGFMGLRRTKNEDTTSACPFLRVKDIVSFLEEIISRDTYGFRHDEHFNNEWWFLFSGDKGGLHMKYYIEIINSLNSGSVDNVHIYAMFEAQDSVENMMKVWFTVYNEQIKAMQEDYFRMGDGKRVIVFLGGDYHFLDDNMGHQGSSATYPSSLDKVLLSHLQNHAGTPHTPQNCTVELRSIEDYVENYNENLADDRSHNNLNENGKYHCSVVGPMIFPLNDLFQVVPPTLHIMLGIVLLIYNLLLDECKSIDTAEGNQAIEEEKEALSREWEIASLEHENVERLLREQGESVVVMINRRNRFEAVANSDHNQNDKLAAGSEASRKSKKRRRKQQQEHENCKSMYCLITAHDKNVEWVQCDECDLWYHMMCEALTPVEELSLADEDYKCISCSSENEIRHQDVFDAKISSLLDVEHQLVKRKINEKVKCDNFKSKYVHFAGDREKALTDALESIKVIRQAYHGNVMVGNHTVKVLKEYLELTSVIKDREPTCSHFNTLFKIFSQIMRLLMTRRFLSDDEIESLQDLVFNFGETFPIFFPNRNITRKIHELIFNVVPFVRRFKTIGMLSEQESESKHAAINAELRALACVRNHAE